MPTYDYVCDACDHKFELYQPITSEPEKKCPACKKLKLRRLIGPGAAIVFKGSGFYQTDYRSESYQKAAKADKSAEGGGKESGKESSASKDGAASGGSSSTTSKSDGGAKSSESSGGAKKRRSKKTE